MLYPRFKLVVTQVAHSRSPPPLPWGLSLLNCPISGNHAKRFPHTLTQGQNHAGTAAVLWAPARRTRLPPSVDQRQAHLRPGHGKDQHWLGVLGQAPGYRRLHYRLSSSRSNAGAVQQLSTEVTVSSGQFFLPATARCQEFSQRAACCWSFPRFSLRAPLFLLTQPCCPHPVMGRWLPSSTPLCQEMFPLMSSPSGT